MYVGATLEARDRVVGLAGDLADRYGSRSAFERTIKRSRNELEKDVRRYERKGNTTRNQVERDVRKARTRLERELRGRRRDAETLLKRNRQAVEGVVQVGVITGERFATIAKERVAAIA